MVYWYQILIIIIALWIAGSIGPYYDMLHDIWTDPQYSLSYRLLWTPLALPVAMILMFYIISKHVINLVRS